MASCAIHLKSKAYFIACQEHKSNGKIFSKKIVRENLQKFKIVNSLQNLGIEVSSERDILKLAKEFAEHDYHGYASLIIFVDHYKMESGILGIVYKHIKRNSTLKYVTKLVLNYSLADESFGAAHYRAKFTRFTPFKGPCTGLVLKLGVYESSQEFHGSVKIKVSAETTEYVEKYLKMMRENIRKKIPFMDNLIVLTFIQLGETHMHTILEEFVERIAFYCDKNCIQELADATLSNIVLPNVHNEVICFKASNVECYVYNINPALAIVINHYSFPEKLNLAYRVGSQIDIKALQDLFQAKKIPYLVIEDASLEDVQTIMQKVRTTEFNGIKDIYILIMSHGDEGDKMHTKTESYSLKDEIVLPLLENSTLANAQKYVIVNACRGIKEYGGDNDEQKDETQKKLSESNEYGGDNDKLKDETQKEKSEPVIYPQDENLMMIFSTQSGFKSMRWAIHGSIFVQKFCEILTDDFDQKQMEAICQETENLIRDEGVFQIPDFQIDEQRPHTIKMEFANFFHNQELLDDMLTFFKTHFKEYINADGTAADKSLYTIRIKKSEEEWQVHGVGYANGALTNAQIAAVENQIESDYADTNVLDINPYGNLLPYYNLIPRLNK